MITPAQTLYQALIPHGHLIDNFDIPDSVKDFIQRIGQAKYNITNLDEAKINFFFIAYKNISLAHACTYGVPNNLTKQGQIFSSTYFASEINFDISLLIPIVTYLSSYCTELKSCFSDISNTGAAEDFADLVKVFHHTQLMIVELDKQIKTYTNQLSTMIEIPNTANLNLDTLIDQLQTLNQMLDTISKKPTSDIQKAANVASQIERDIRFLPTILTQKGLLKDVIKTQFSQHYPTNCQSYIEYLDEFFLNVHKLIFYSLEIFAFSENQTNSAFLTSINKLTRECPQIITQVHSLLKYRCNYTYAVYSIKISFQKIHALFSQLFQNVYLGVNASPLFFRSSIMKLLQPLYEYFDNLTNEFLAKMDSLFSILQDTKRYIVFIPLTPQIIRTNQISAIAADYQKEIYRVAQSLIQNQYSPRKLEGMMQLVQISYNKFIDFLDVQLSGPMPINRRISYLHKRDNIEYAVNSFSEAICEYGKSDSKSDSLPFLNAALESMNLIFESAMFESDNTIVTLLNSVLDLFRQFMEKLKKDHYIIENEDAKIEAKHELYLKYRRLMNLVIFHNSSLIGRFFTLMTDQLVWATDNGSVPHIMDARKIGKAFIHFLKSIKKSVLYDKGFVMPTIIPDVIAEFDNYIAQITFRANNHSATISQSLKNFSILYNNALKLFEYIDKVRWDCNINDFVERVNKTISDFESFGGLLHAKPVDSPENDGKLKNTMDLVDIISSAFNLSQQLFEIRTLGRSIQQISEDSMSKINDLTYQLFEKSTMTSINLQKIAELSKDIVIELETFNPVLKKLTTDTSSKLDSISTPFFVVKMKPGHRVLEKMNKALLEFQNSIDSNDTTDDASIVSDLSNNGTPILSDAKKRRKHTEYSHRTPKEDDSRRKKKREGHSHTRRGHTVRKQDNKFNPNLSDPEDNEDSKSEYEICSDKSDSTDFISSNAVFKSRKSKPSIGILPLESDFTHSFDLSIFDLSQTDIDTYEYIKTEEIRKASKRLRVPTVDDSYGSFPVLKPK